MKIIFLSNSSWNIYNFRMPIIKEFISRNHQIIILSPLDSYADKLKELGCEVIDIKFKANKISPIGDFIYLIKLFYILKLNKPEIIFNFTIKPVILGSIISSFLKIKTINTITGLGTYYIKKNIFTNVLNFMYFISQRKVSKVLFQNNDDIKYFLDNKIITSNKCELVPGSGVNINYFSSSKYPAITDKIIFLYVGRLIIDKGVNELFDAIKLVKKKFSNTEFCFIGDINKNNPKTIDIKMFDELCNKKMIQYLGFTNNVKDFIKNSHCLILPSYREGLPKSVLEAMSMSRPVIATNVPGCREIVKNGYNGLLCDPYSALSLSDSICEFIKLDINKKIEMGQNGRKMVNEKYVENIIVSKYFNLIT